MCETTKIADRTQIAQAIQKFSEEVQKNLGSIKEVALIGIVTRGETIAKRLMNLLKERGMNVYYGVMDITLYRDDFAQKMHKAVVRGSTINFSLDDKHVILVDDVIFTGRTARSAINQVFDFGRPKKLELMCLVDRGNRELPIMPNYVGFKVDTKPEDEIRTKLEENDTEEGIYLLSNKLQN